MPLAKIRTILETLSKKVPQDPSTQSLLLLAQFQSPRRISVLANF